jgi:hypothetical protein
MTPELVQAGIRLVDEAHGSWSVAALQCAEALRAWREAGASDRCAANLAYRAALDREEAAARDLERLAAIADMPRGPSPTTVYAWPISST